MRSEQKSGPTFLALLALAALAPYSAAQDEAIAAREADVRAREAEVRRARSELSRLYEALETAFARIREGAPAETAKELAAVLDEALTAARRAGAGDANAKRAAPKIRRAFTAAAADGFRRARDGVVTALEPVVMESLKPWLEPDAARLLEATPDALVDASLGALARSGQPFVALWNAELSGRLAAAETWRKAVAALRTASFELEVQKDPLRRFQAGAPPGMARIPGGSYAVGSRERAEKHGFHRKRTRATVRTFFLDLHEVTHGRYWKDFHAKLTTDEERERHLPVDDNKKPIWLRNPETGLFEPAEDQMSLPVTGVNLVSAMAYAAAVGKRIPTEDEWEAAATGPKDFDYPWGMRWEPGRCNDVRAGIGGSMPVDAMPEGRSAFGIFHLAGNVSEWTVTYEGGQTVVGDVATTESVVVHGGAFGDDTDAVSCRWRWHYNGVYQRSRNLGFRCAQDAP